MIARLLILLAVSVGLMLFTAGVFMAEGTLKGPAIGGRLAVSANGRTVVLTARRYRPNRTYYCLNVR